MTERRSSRLSSSPASTVRRAGRVLWRSIALLLVPFTIASTGGSAAAQTPQWYTNPSNGHRYAFTSPMTWTQAQATAQANGGNLATVRSAAEDSWISLTFGPGPYWIGFTDRQVEGTWVWVSGEPVQFTNWCNTQPDDNCGGRSEDYAHIWGQPPCSTGKWNDNADDGCVFPGLMPGVMEVIPASYATYRLSCDSSAGTPLLLNATLPRVGTALQLIVAGMGSQKIGYLLFGFDDNYWQFNQLPLDLTSLGADGCFLNVDPLLAFFVPTDAFGTARPVIRIPNDPSLMTLEFFNQYVTLDDAPPGRLLRICTTNAGRGIIGL